jgi:hypothetical protein
MLLSILVGLVLRRALGVLWLAGAITPAQVDLSHQSRVRWHLMDELGGCMDRRLVERLFSFVIFSYLFVDQSAGIFATHMTA